MEILRRSHSRILVVITNSENDRATFLHEGPSAKDTLRLEEQEYKTVLYGGKRLIDALNASISDPLHIRPGCQF